MPWKVERRGNVWLTVNEDTKRIAGRHKTREKAEAQRRLLEGIRHGTIKGRKVKVGE